MPSGSRRQRKRRSERRRAAQTGVETAQASDPVAESAEAAQPTPSKPKPSRRPAADPMGPPPPPWGSFPLVEILVLAGIVAVVIGAIFVSGTAKIAFVVGGLLLCSLAGLELAIREHLGGYRSHTLVLAGLPAVAALAFFYFGASSVAVGVRLAIAGAIFAAAAFGLTAVFRSRSGGHAFRVRPERR